MNDAELTVDTISELQAENERLKTKLEKIDKAIEEISNLHGEYFTVMDKDYKTTHKRFLEPNKVLEILKRNIGE